MVILLEKLIIFIALNWHSDVYRVATITVCYNANGVLK
jgi:hypothetical protein